MTDDRSPPILITGCSSGIGHATALRLASRGRWTVYATARRLDTLADLAAAGCRTRALDVTDEASMRAVVSEIEAAHGALDALVNNAGYSQSGAVEAVPLDRVRAQFETNVFGLIRLTQLVLPAMRQARRGRIVLLSSMGGKLVFPGGGMYHATKHAIEALGDALRFELRGFGIGVVLIEPGLIRTNFAEAAVGAMTGVLDETYGDFHARVAEATRKSYVQGKAALLAGSPEDVAAVIETAITSTHPRPRYKVSPSARIFIALRRLLGDRGWDRFLRSVYPSPGSES
jgi:NAD(P)-dependent dehydrogenase (short-subunit alcohol dehydrogenase family)